MKTKLSFWAIMVGMIGALFAVGGIDTAETVTDWITVGGVAFTSLMLMQMGVWMIKDEI